MHACRLHAQNQPPQSSWMSLGYKNKQRKVCSTFWCLFEVLEVKDQASKCHHACTFPFFFYFLALNLLELWSTSCVQPKASCQLRLTDHEQMCKQFGQFFKLLVIMFVRQTQGRLGSINCSLLSIGSTWGGSR